MISKLLHPAVSFRGQENTSSVSNSYKELLEKNKQIANNANNATESSINPQLNGSQIPMQGNIGQNLNVVV